MDLARYMDLFVADAREHLAAASKVAGSLQAVEPDPGDVRDLFRHLHSIKGMAASMGLGAISTLAHAAEHLLGTIRDGTVPGGQHRAALILQALECIERMVDGAEAGRPASDDRAARITRALGDAGEAAAAPEPTEASTSSPGEEPCLRIALIVRRDGAFPAVRAAMVLGRLATLGRIVRSEPPMAALRTGRFDGRLFVLLVTEHTVDALARTLSDWPEVDTFTLTPASVPAAKRPARSEGPWVRVRADRLDRAVDKTLELARELARLEARLEGVEDGEARRAAARARLLARRAHAEAIELRMVPFDSLAARLVRGARDLAERLGKPIEFEVEGRDVRVDRALLEPLADPLLHLLRNAVDHGIERPDERARARKSAGGRVRLVLERRAGFLEVRVEDDGRGLDPVALRERAIELGLLTPSQASALGAREALQLVTLPGFTTATTATEISGRGVGMDVVRDAVTTLGGRLEIVAPPGRGTRVTLALPARASILDSLLVRSGGEMFAAPILDLAKTVHADDRMLAWRDGRPVLEDGDGSVAFVRLDRELGLPERSRSAGVPSVLVYERRGRRYGVVVDDVLGRRELTVSALRAPLHDLATFSAVALLDDGTPILVLEPSAFAPRDSEA